MGIQIDQAKVAMVVRDLNTFLAAQDGLNIGEVMVGISELMGRAIVEHCSNHIQMRELRDICVAHIDRTIQIGSHTTGKGPFERG